MKNKKRYYRIKKSFQGGLDIYYACMPVGKRIIRKGGVSSYWEAQLEEWGEHTNGGHCYGYRITAKSIGNRLPVHKRWQILKFNKYYLEKK